MGHLKDGHYTLNLTEEEYKEFESLSKEEKEDWLRGGEFVLDDYKRYETDFYGEYEVKDIEEV